MKLSAVFAPWGALVVTALVLGGCGAPEQCKGCLTALADGSALEAPRSDVPIATGGATGSGGMVGTGGAATGGMGTGGAATGGMGTGGAATGGAGTGGAAMGGRGTGGANTGGANTGGANTGGAMAGMGGRASGGAGVGGAAMGGAGGAAIDPDLVVWYKFDNNATDSAMLGGTARNATVTAVGGGTAAYSMTTRQVGTHALNLGGMSSTVGGYASVPNLQSQLPGGVTIALWVNVRGNQNWQRVFDFGTMATTPLIYMFLTTNQGTASPNAVRFSISTNGTANEQSINMSTPMQLPLNTWHHVAVVLPMGNPYTGTLYIDGAVAGTNTAMTIHPTAIAMPNSYIGRSQWGNDPYFNGYVDDFRVYRRALTAAEIAALP